MATPISFSAYLGWVDGSNPANLPPDFRLLAASDLLRYERFGVDAAKRINEHDTALANVMTKAQADLAYASRTQLTTEVTTRIAADVPPLVAQSIAADGTVAAAAAAAVELEIGERDLVEGGELADPDLSFAVVDEDGRRTWIEADPAGKPTPRAISLIADGVAPQIEAAVGEGLGLEDLDTAGSGLAFSVADEDGRRTWMEVAPDGGPTPHSMKHIVAKLPAGAGGGGGAGISRTTKAWVYDPAATVKVVESTPAVTTDAFPGPADYWVEPTIVDQEMQGFGAALTDSAAYNLWVNLTAERRGEVLRELFDPDTGFTIVRISVASSDFQHTSTYYSYDDGGTDLTLTNFSIGSGTPGTATATRDYKYVVPVLLEIMAINPKVKVMAAPWSPPAHIKSNNNLVGGSIVDTAANFTYYAGYFRRFVEQYRALGIPIWCLSVQNEPTVATPYTSCIWTAAQRVRFVRDFLRPELNANGLQVKIIDWDDNVHPLSTGTSQSTVAFDGLGLDNMGVFDGIGWHGYGASLMDDEVRARKAIQQGYEQHFTEFRTFLTETTDDVSKIMFKAVGLLGIMAGLQSITLWNMVLDEAGLPTTANMTNRSGVITVPSNKSGVIVRNEEYYMLRLLNVASHGLSRRCSARNGIRTRTGTGIGCVGFVNDDGSTGVWITRYGHAGTVRVVNVRTKEAVNVQVANNGITVVLFGCPTTYATKPLITA